MAVSTAAALLRTRAENLMTYADRVQRKAETLQERMAGGESIPLDNAFFVADVASACSLLATVLAEQADAAEKQAEEVRRQARAEVQERGAAHDCEEWRDTPDRRCALCDRPEARA